MSFAHFPRHSAPLCARPAVQYAAHARSANAATSAGVPASLASIAHCSRCFPACHSLPWRSDASAHFSNATIACFFLRVALYFTPARGGRRE